MCSCHYVAHLHSVYDLCFTLRLSNLLTTFCTISLSITVKNNNIYNKILVAVSYYGKWDKIVWKHTNLGCYYSNHGGENLRSLLSVLCYFIFIKYQQVTIATIMVIANLPLEDLQTPTITLCIEFT